MKLLDSVNGVAAHIQAAVDVARGKDHPAAQIVKLRECLQTASEQVLALREEVTALEGEKAKLEERLTQRGRFEHERGEFVVRKLETGSVVYVRKRSGQGEDDPVIHYCAHCFKRGEQEILQLEEQAFNRDEHKCRVCGSKAFIPNGRRAEVRSVPRRSRWDGFP